MVKGSLDWLPWHDKLYVYNYDEVPEQRKSLEDIPAKFQFSRSQVEKVKRLAKQGTIETVYIFRNPLIYPAVTEYLAYHAFVVTKVRMPGGGYLYYSFEKQSEGLLIQISSDFGDVKNFYLRKDRKQSVLLYDSDSQIQPCMSNPFAVIKLIFCDDSIWEEYEFLQNNCQNFVEEVFNNTSLTKMYVGENRPGGFSESERARFKSCQKNFM